MNWLNKCKTQINIVSQLLLLPLVHTYYASEVVCYCNSTQIGKHNSHLVCIVLAYTQNIDSQCFSALAYLSSYSQRWKVCTSLGWFSSTCNPPRHMLRSSMPKDYLPIVAGSSQCMRWTKWSCSDIIFVFLAIQVIQVSSIMSCIVGYGTFLCM